MTLLMTAGTHHRSPAVAVGGGIFGLWGALLNHLERIIESDERCICAACNDKFANRFEGIQHVLRCHPEYQGVMLDNVGPNPRGFSPAPVPVAVRVRSVRV